MPGKGGKGKWLALSSSAAGIAQVLPPSIHTTKVFDIMDNNKAHICNTWIYAQVDSVSRAKDLTPSSVQHMSDGADVVPSQVEATKILDDMAPIMRGDPRGHAFVNTGTHSMDAGSALAAFVVARYSNKGDIIWDLCKARPLLSLPMAVVGQERNYVCVTGNRGGPKAYDQMVNHMYNMQFLLNECSTGPNAVYDGHWDTDANVFNKLSVRPSILFLCSCVSLYHHAPLHHIHCI